MGDEDNGEQQAEEKVEEEKEGKEKTRTMEEEEEEEPVGSIECLEHQRCVVWQRISRCVCAFSFFVFFFICVHYGSVSAGASVFVYDQYDDDVFYLFLQKQKMGAELHIPLVRYVP